MRRIIAALCSVLLLSGLVTGVAGARQLVRGPGYRAYAPSGWKIDKTSIHGWRRVAITTPDFAPNGARTAVVVVAVASVKTVERRFHIKVGNEAAMAEKLISIPRGARLVQLQSNPAPTVLAGVQGAVVSVTYNLRGDGTQHSATVVLQGRRVYVLQVIRDQSLSELGSTASDMVRSTWRWT